MTVIGRDRLEEIFHEINILTSLEEVHKKAVEISMADIDDKAKGFLHRAIDIKRDGLIFISGLAVESEIVAGEVSDD